MEITKRVSFVRLFGRPDTANLTTDSTGVPPNLPPNKHSTIVPNGHITEFSTRAAQWIFPGIPYMPRSTFVREIMSERRAGGELPWWGGTCPRENIWRQESHMSLSRRWPRLTNERDYVAKTCAKRRYPGTCWLATPSWAFFGQARTLWKKQS